jgi:hypothetical protein
MSLPGSLPPEALPGLAFPPVGPLGLRSPPSSVVCSATTAPCPSQVASLVARFPIPCLLPRFVSQNGSLQGWELPPAPGLLVGRYPYSSGMSDKETKGSPKFPSSPCERMPCSQTPVVPCVPRLSVRRIAAFRSLHDVGFPSVEVILPVHNYTHFGALSHGLRSRFLRLRTPIAGVARGVHYSPAG